MFSFLTTLLGAALLAMFSVVTAAPIIQMGQVTMLYDPQILSPKAGDVWNVGSLQTVRWNISAMPASVALSTGLLLLGFEANSSEHLDLNNPLANKFILGLGEVTFFVPNVVDRNDYIVVLFGDSGNKSPMFTITSGL